jgi:hypothetical protein
MVLITRIAIINTIALKLNSTITAVSSHVKINAIQDTIVTLKSATVYHDSQKT